MVPGPDEARCASPRLWRWYAALLLAPALVLWRQDNPLFTGAGYIDPWFYYGFFRNLAEFKGTLFFGTYYGSRLSWILPGWAVHSLLPPLAASAVLHLLVHSTAVLSLFTVLRLLTGVRAAFLAALFFSVNPWLWAATGWDYLDGAGLAYCLLALLLFAVAVGGAKPRGWLAGAGAALAAMIYTNLFLAALAPLPFLFFLARHVAAGGRIGPRDVLAPAIWCAGGFTAATAALGCVNLWLDGHFWFYAPSVLAAIRLMSERNPWFTTVWGPHGLAPHLWMAALAGVASLAALVDWRRGLRGPVLPAGLFLAALAAHAVLQTRGTPALGLSHYASYLLPFAFLAIGAIFFQGAGALGNRAYYVLCPAAAMCAAALWADYRAEWIPVWPAGVPVAAGIAAVLMTASFLLRTRGAGTVLAAAGLLVLTGELRTVYLDPHGNRAGEERLIFARSRIEAERRSQPVRVWYSESDPAQPDHRALVSSYMGTLSMLGTAFPADKCDDTVEPGTLVAVSSSAADVEATARRALAACWSPLGMEPRLAGADRLQGSLGGYDVVRFRAALTPGAQLAFEVPPLDRWQADAGANVRKDGGGIHLRTQPVAQGIALVSPPLTAPEDGQYRFALRYRPGTGHIGFGAIGTSDSAWIRRDVDERRLKDIQELSVWVELEAGEQFRLAAANYHWANRSSSALLESVSAIRVKKTL